MLQWNRSKALARQVRLLTTTTTTPPTTTSATPIPERVVESFSTAVASTTEKTVTGAISSGSSASGKNAFTKTSVRQPISRHWDPRHDTLRKKVNDSPPKVLARRPQYEHATKILDRLHNNQSSEYAAANGLVINPKIEIGVESFFTPKEVSQSITVDARMGMKKSDLESPVGWMCQGPGSKKSVWTNEKDKILLQLRWAGMEWPRIAKQIDIPAPACYRRYYTVLDPFLELIWRNPRTGEPDNELMENLVDLVENKGMTFSTLEHFLLTKSSKPKFLKDALGNVINRVALEEGYRDWKTKQQSRKKVHHLYLMNNAVKRAIELFGTENWDLVTKEAQAILDFERREMGLDSPPSTTTTRATRPKAKTTTNLQKGQGEGKDQNRLRNTIIQHFTLPHNIEHMILTKEDVIQSFNQSNRKRLPWRLDDDAVMIRWIVKLSINDQDALSLLEQSALNQPIIGHGSKKVHQYWGQISEALGNHTAEECRGRWAGLLELSDRDKIATAKRTEWHPSEQYVFWILWKQNYLKFKADREQQQQQQQQPQISEELPATSASLSLYAESQNGSFANQIAKWLRHRTATECVRYFEAKTQSILGAIFSASVKAPATSTRTSVLAALESTSAAARASAATATTATATTTTTGESADIDASGAGLDILLEQVNEKIAQQYVGPRKLFAGEKGDDTPRIGQRSLAMTPKVNIRSDWSDELSRITREVVMKAKQGVKLADEDLDWERIAYQVNKAEFFELFIGGGGSDDGTNQGFNSDQLRTVNHDLDGKGIVTADQCKTYWEMYLLAAKKEGKTKSPSSSSSSSSSASTSTSSTLSSAHVPVLSQSVSTSALSSDDTSSNKARSYPRPHLKSWSDHERLLLQQGIRKHGNSWADIRAQFLPNRDISDIIQHWTEVSSVSSSLTNDPVESSEMATKTKVDRLQESDYIGLLSALKKVTSSKEQTHDYETHHNNGNSDSIEGTDGDNFSTGYPISSNDNSSKS